MCCFVQSYAWEMLSCHGTHMYLRPQPIYDGRQGEHGAVLHGSLAHKKPPAPYKASMGLQPARIGEARFEAPLANTANLFFILVIMEAKLTDVWGN